MRIIKLHLFVSEFGAKAFCSLVESRVKTKELKPFSTFAVEGVINSNILRESQTSVLETSRLISKF